VLDRTSHPVGIVTNQLLVIRDIDYSGADGQTQSRQVAISVTTLDARLARTMEPRA